MNSITLDQPIKPGDNLALITPASMPIEAGSILVFAGDDKPVELTVRTDASVGWYRIETETYKGDREIPAKSMALILPSSNAER
jgi:hypothetical protein